MLIVKKAIKTTCILSNIPLSRVGSNISVCSVGTESFFFNFEFLSVHTVDRDLVQIPSKYHLLPIGICQHSHFMRDSILNVSDICDTEAFENRSMSSSSFYEPFYGLSRVIPINPSEKHSSICYSLAIAF